MDDNHDQNVFLQLRIWSVFITITPAITGENPPTRQAACMRTTVSVVSHSFSPSMFLLWWGYCWLYMDARRYNFFFQLNSIHLRKDYWLGVWRWIKKWVALVQQHERKSLNSSGRCAGRSLYSCRHGSTRIKCIILYAIMVYYFESEKIKGTPSPSILILLSSVVFAPFNFFSIFQCPFVPPQRNQL